MAGSYWQLDAPAAERWTATPLPRSCDFVIVGAGFAGLMTAIRLRELHPSASIAVVEAERVGHGASGRNAGFVSPLAAPVWLLGAERSPEQAWGASRINREIHAIARWIREHAPGCELAPASLALQAQSRASEAALREFARAVAHVGLDHRIGESRVHRGCSYLEMAAYTLHPFKLVTGLAEHAVGRGIVLRERARVQRVEPVRSGGARVVLEDRSTIAANKVVMCTNAYSGAVDVGERPHAFVVHSFMAATAPVVGELPRDGDLTVEINAAQAYHRTHRGRVIYGGIDRFRAPDGGDHAVPDRERAALAKLVASSFPGMNLELDHLWSGCFHTTTTGLPIIRTSERNVALVWNVGYGGTGVALSLACARLAACVASNGRWTDVDDTRFLALIHATRISVRDSARVLARIARGVAMPWQAA